MPHGTLTIQNFKQETFISIQRVLLVTTGVILLFGTSSPTVAQEPAQPKNEIKIPPVIKPLESGLTPLAETAKPETERVFCGSPKQRNWKNASASNIAIGERLAAEKGWTGAQFTALKELWSCESSWTTLAGNTDSGAYGIPQSLPASKMAAVGADYLTNPETQIRWGLGYIEARYISPQVALDHHYAVNWY